MKQRRPTVSARQLLEAARSRRREILERTAAGRAKLDRAMAGADMTDLDALPVMVVATRPPAPKKRAAKEPAKRRVVLPTKLPKVRARGGTSGKLYECRYCGGQGHNQRTCGKKQRDEIRARGEAGSVDARQTSSP